MKPIKSYMEIYLVVKFDSYEDRDKAERLLEDNQEIAGEVLTRAAVLTSCPHCGDDEFFDGSYCGHCGHSI